MLEKKNEQVLVLNPQHVPYLALLDSSGRNVVAAGPKNFPQNMGEMIACMTELERIASNSSKK